VFQRNATGRLGTPVYWFVESERLPSGLEFEATARATAARVFKLHLEEEISSTLARRGLVR
jgi:hypothetical protein